MSVISAPLISTEPSLVMMMAGPLMVMPASLSSIELPPAVSVILPAFTSTSAAPISVVPPAFKNMFPSAKTLTQSDAVTSTVFAPSL